MDAGRILKHYLEDRGRTKVWLAGQLKVTHAYVHHLISGRKSINLETWMRIRALLELNFSESTEFVAALTLEIPGLTELIRERETPAFKAMVGPLTEAMVTGAATVHDAKIDSTKELDQPPWSLISTVTGKSLQGGRIELYSGIGSPTADLKACLFVGIPRRLSDPVPNKPDLCLQLNVERTGAYVIPQDASSSLHRLLQTRGILIDHRVNEQRISQRRS